MRTCHVAHHGLCADTLSNENVMLTLEVHQIPHYRTVDGVVWAFEAATVTGRDGVTRDASDWIRVPTTIHSLAAWLGY